MKGFARNAARISISAIYTGATVLLSAYNAKAEFISLSDSAGSESLNRISAPISGTSARVMLLRGAAA